MNSLSLSQQRWTLAGIVGGVGAALTYFLAIAGPLPILASYIAFMAFGPFLCVAIVSFFHYFKVSHDTITLRLGSVLLVLAGAINTLMAALQGALRLYMYDLPQAESTVETTKVAFKLALHAGNALQLGADVAWDYFVLPGMALFAIGIMGHPRFQKWFCWLGVAIGAAGMVFNCWTFPDPPNAAGLIDVGPLAGIWFTVFTIQMIRLYLEDRRK